MLRIVQFTNLFTFKYGPVRQASNQHFHFRKVIKQQSCGVSRAFQTELTKVPTLREVTKPTEAEDRCWKCDGTEDVDKVRSIRPLSARKAEIQLS